MPDVFLNHAAKPLCIQQSNHSAKTGLFVFSGNMWLNGAGRVQHSLAIPQRRYSPSTVVPAKRTVYAHHSRSVLFLLLFSPMLSRTKAGSEWDIGKWQTIRPGARLKSSMWTHKVHPIDLRVTHYCFGGVDKVLGKKNDSRVLFGLVNKWLDRSSMTTEYDSKWPDIDLFSDASSFFFSSSRELLCLKQD